MTPPDATQIAAPVADLALHEQMLMTMAQIGRVVDGSDAHDPPKPKGPMPTVLVHVGGEAAGTFTRTWMPWLVGRAGGDGEWWAPDVDEQVLVLTPAGNLSQGIIIGSLLRGSRLNFPAGADLGGDPDQRHSVPDGNGAGPVDTLAADGHVRVYRDGTTLSYDRGSHCWDLRVRIAPEQDPVISVSAHADGDTPPTALTLTVGTTTIVMTDEAITLTAGGTTLTIDAAGVDAGPTPS